MTALPGIARTWEGIGLPGIFEPGWATYSPIPLDAMSPPEHAIDSTLGWLLETQTHDRSLERGPDDPAERDADAAGLQAIAPSVVLPAAFRKFIEDPEPRRHIRSATACYLDLAHFTVAVSDGGVLIHFLSDQQWVLHWLLYLGADGSEAVVVSPDPLGFDVGEGDPVRLVTVDDAPDLMVVCSETFEEFLYRFWIENELFFRLAVDKVSADALPTPLREYASGHPRADSPDRPGARVAETRPAESIFYRVVRVLRSGRRPRR